MATAEEENKKKDEKIPDTYSVPEWFQTLRNTDVTVSTGPQLLIETKSTVLQEPVKETTANTESAKPRADSPPSSGRSSVIIVDAEHQPDTAAQENSEEQTKVATEDQADSQTTIKAEQVAESKTEQIDGESSAIPEAASLPVHKIKETTYTAIKDTFAPALIANNSLLAFEQPTTIAFSVKTSKELPLADAIVLQLAKDFDAKAILMDAEDIEDLAWEFDKQQKRFDKIEKDKKLAEKEKKKAEKEKKRVEREEKKAKRAAKKAEKATKAAENADKPEDKPDAKVNEVKELNGADSTGTANVPHETVGASDTAASTTTGIDEAPAEPTSIAKDTISPEAPSAAVDASTQTTSQADVKDADPSQAKSEPPASTSGNTTTEQNPVSSEQKQTPETSSSDNTIEAKSKNDETPITDSAAVESKDIKADGEGSKKDDAAATDSEKKKKDDDSDTDSINDTEEVDTPDDNSDSDDDIVQQSEFEYWDPCRPSTNDSGYEMSRTYLGNRGSSNRSKKIFKRGKNALTSLCRDPSTEKEIKAQSGTSEGAAVPEGIKPEKVDGTPAADAESLDTLDVKLPDAKAEADKSTSTEPQDGATNLDGASSSHAALLEEHPPKHDAQSAADSSTAETSLACSEADKSTVSGSKDKANQDEADSKDETVPTKPLLICIRDVNNIMNNDNGADILARFGDLISSCREDNHRAVLVITLVEGLSPFKDDSCPCGYPYCNNNPKRLEKMLKRLKIDESAKIDLSPSKGKSKDDKDEKKEEHDEEPDAATRVKQEYTNVRRLKRYLRHGVPDASAMPWFATSEQWAHDDPDKKLAKISDKKWDDTKVRRAARQVIGRGIASGKFTFDDVLYVVDRLDGESEKDDDDDKEKSEAAKAFEKKLEKVKQDCNTHEERLLESVVKPSALESTYEDVIIDDDTKDAVRQLITLFKFKAGSKSKKLIKLLNITGAMFYGPPGTGKTHLARAMANDYGACMLALEASTLMDMWVGETEKLIKAAFTLATKLHPCILFIDEADSLFRKRTSCDKSWERNALTMYLQQMDGIGTDNKRPFVVVATNRPSDLDEAFLRRLPHKVLFSLPSEQHRAAILKLFLEDEDIDASVDLNDVAKQTRGLSGSDLKSLCGQAVLAWATQKAVTADSTDEGLTSELKLTAEHFKLAIKRTRATVSRQSLADVDSFARQYDSARF